MANRTKRTAKKGEKFLEQLRETGGNVSRACKAEGIGRTMAYAWRAADADFARAWDEAVEAGLDDLEQEARRRAYDGTLKPVFYKGGECGHIREYSDTLLIFMLKGGRPEKYRERFDVEIKGAKDRAEAAIAEFIKQTGKSREEAIQFLKPHIPQISELVH